MRDKNLLDAIVKSKVGLVARMLKQGINPNYSEDREGITALHFAAQRGNIEIVFLLLAAGAKLNVKTIEGASPIEIATISEQQQVPKILIRTVVPDTCLKH